MGHCPRVALRRSLIPPYLPAGDEFRMNFECLGGSFSTYLLFSTAFAYRYPRRVGAHRKHSDFREESKTERVLWSALAYVPSDKAKKLWVAPAALAFAPLSAPIAPAQTAQDQRHRQQKSRVALGGGRFRGRPA